MRRLIVLTLFLACSAPLYAEELRLEGVIEDPSGQSPAFAVINGNPHRAGDVLGTSRIIDVHSTYITLVNTETGAETTLELQSAPAQPTTPPPASLSESTTPTVAPRTFWDNVNYYKQHPNQMMNPVWEWKAIQDLAAVNNASVRYYEAKEFFPVKIRQLTLDHFLPEVFESGQKGKYHFYFTNIPMKPDNLELHADPIDAGSGLRYFYVGPDAVIRVSMNAPATEASPEFKSWFAGKN